MSNPTPLTFATFAKLVRAILDAADATQEPLSDTHYSRLPDGVGDGGEECPSDNPAGCVACAEHASNAAQAKVFVRRAIAQLCQVRRSPFFGSAACLEGSLDHVQSAGDVFDADDDGHSRTFGDAVLALEAAYEALSQADGGPA